MRNLVKRYTILFLVLVSVACTAFGQKTEREEDLLVGNVKSVEVYHYRFTTSDSINHDDFMRRFYQCVFDTERMLSFADSLNPVNEKEFYSKEYDSFGNRTKIGDARYQYEYDNQGKMMKRIEVNDGSYNDTTYFNYDEVGRLLEERYLDNMMHHRTIQRIYDKEGHLSEYIMKDLDQDDDSILFHEKFEYDKKGILRKSEYCGSWFRGCRKYDSRGNFTFFQEENYGLNESGLLSKSRTRNRYKYDGNDSIIREVSKTTRWYGSPKHKGVESQIKSKSERRVSRNVDGVPIEEIRVSNHNNSITTKKLKYDELGRVIEEEWIEDRYPWKTIKIWRYYKDTRFVEYYAENHGKEYEYGEENLFFYDEQGDRIAHIKWDKGLVYRFEVYRYEYYE